MALGLGWLAGFSPAIGMRPLALTAHNQWQAIGLGVLATVPLLAALIVMDRFPIGPLDRIRQISVEAIGQLFPQPRLWQLAAVSAAAGLGEELLFRGLLQAGLAQWIGGGAGPWIGLAIASLTFGAFHWLNTTYALLAALAGAYFGWLLIASGSLWTPIVAHGLYDFVALYYLVRSSQMLK